MEFPVSIGLALEDIILNGLLLHVHGPCLLPLKGVSEEGFPSEARFVVVFDASDDLSHLGVDSTGTLVGVFLHAAPTAVVSAAIAQGMGGDAELAGAAVVAASLASFPAYIVWALIL